MVRGAWQRFTHLHHVSISSFFFLSRFSRSRLARSSLFFLYPTSQQKTEQRTGAKRGAIYSTLHPTQTMHASLALKKRCFPTECNYRIVCLLTLPLLVFIFSLAAKCGCCPSMTCSIVMTLLPAFFSYTPLLLSSTSHDTVADVTMTHDKNIRPMSAQSKVKPWTQSYAVTGLIVDLEIQFPVAVTTECVPLRIHCVNASRVRRLGKRIQAHAPTRVINISSRPTHYCEIVERYRI